MQKGHAKKIWTCREDIQIEMEKTRGGVEAICGKHREIFRQLGDEMIAVKKWC